jgi:hypothetical protein
LALILPVFAKGIIKDAAISLMKAIDITIHKNPDAGIVIKLTFLFIFLTLSVMGMNTLYQEQREKLAAKSELLNQKSSLVVQMHKEMLSISSTQLQILHASSEQQVKENLWQLSQLVSDHLIHYHQLENIVDESDAHILMQFRIGFDQWNGFNKNLLSYANVVSDSGFINTLNKVNLAFSQFDSSSDERQLLITQLKQDINNEQGLSN